MSNIVQLRPTRRVVSIAHRVTFDLVPRAVVEELFNAAIVVGWAAENEAYSCVDREAAELMAALQKAVGAASQYTVPVEHEFEEPV